MRKIGFTETVLRDAQQSLIATRMPFSVIEPVLADLDKAGYYSLECWGGATFDACLRYLNEDPWERLRAIRRACPNSRLQMLLRGQNLLGYKHYPDDVVRAFVRKSVENGIDIIRIFDALGDLRNVETAVDETLKAGAVASGTICFTTSPVHTLESFAAMAKRLEEMGVQSICIKDMAGIMSPKASYDLVKAVRETVKLPIVVHTHATTGMGYMTLLKAVEAGADVIDTAISSMSGGTSQPATETMRHVLKQYGYDTGLDLQALLRVNRHFKAYTQDCLDKGLLNPIALETSTDALSYQIPGGMLSNLIKQLSDAGRLDKLDEVLEETPRVRADLGYPPLVTPMSQMVGAQATLNVLLGKRYQTISNEIQAYVRGEYGKAPAPVNEELIRLVLGDDKPCEGRFADTLAPGLDSAKAEIGDLAESDEDVLSYVAFPQQARAFFETRRERRKHTYTYKIRKV